MRKSPIIKFEGETSHARLALGFVRVLVVILVAGSLCSSAPAEPTPWREAVRNFELAFSQLGDQASRTSAIQAIAAHDRIDGLDLLFSGLVFIEDRVEILRITYGNISEKLRPLAKDILYPEQHKERATLEKQRKSLSDLIKRGEAVESLIVESMIATNQDTILKRIARSGLTHDHWVVRHAAAEVLGEVGYTEASKYLLKSLRDDDARVRTAGVEALANMRVEKMEKTLIRTLEKDEAWQVRYAAIQALANLGSRDCVQALVAAMAREKGRLIGDIHQRLRILTGQKLLPRYEPWRDWWEKVKDDYRAHTIIKRSPLPPLLQRRDPSLPPISYSGIRTFSDRLVFILDISDSMNDATSTKNLQADSTTNREAPGRSKLTAAREELKSAIRSLTSKDYFNIIVYNHHVKKWQDKMVQANPSNITLALRFLDSLEATGGTNIYDALEIAFNLGGFGAYDRYYRSSVDTIFLLSDGAPSHGRITDEAIIRREIRKANKLQKIKIHTVAIGHLADGIFLKRLAKENNGEHIERF